MRAIGCGGSAFFRARLPGRSWREPPMHPTSIEVLATVLFAAAVLHTFCVKRFAHWAHRYEDGCLREQCLRFLSETEVVFGLWAATLFFGIAALEGSVAEAVRYIDGLRFDEPKFVFVVMVVSATRPVVHLAECLITWLSRCLPFRESLSFYAAALSLGPLLSSFITEPAAMTLLAILLKRRYFDQRISRPLAYATLGLLFVNISIGGTLTHFAAPPVLMVSGTWQWGTIFMLSTFGWKAAMACVASTALTTSYFRRELRLLPAVHDERQSVPAWLTFLHVLTLALVVTFAHHPDVLLGVLVMFLGLTKATQRCQDELKLREGLLVGFFLSGLVTLGSLQSYWLQPLLSRLDGAGLYFGATCLTAITDNAALTYLGSTVEGLSQELKYALVAGAVTGGGLTVIANAPNPVGAGILQGAKVFNDEGISPLGLLLGALMPTAMAIVFFWLLR